MKKFILKLLGFTTEEIYLFQSIKSARNIQDFLWGDYNTKWNLEEWKRMFKKRMVKIDHIDAKNPHAKIEFKKRVLQNTAVGISLLRRLEKDEIEKDCEIPSNLPEYKSKVIEIPPMVHPHGKHWEQPNPDDITICGEHAFMDQTAFDKLKTYSTSTPSGVYEGKMWKAEKKDDNWYLCWYENDESGQKCHIRYKIIVIEEWKKVK